MILMNIVMPAGLALWQNIAVNEATRLWAIRWSRVRRQDSGVEWCPSAFVSINQMFVKNKPISSNYL